jgi:hypothetical protein
VLFSTMLFAQSRCLFSARLLSRMNLGRLFGGYMLFGTRLFS